VHIGTLPQPSLPPLAGFVNNAEYNNVHNNRATSPVVTETPKVRPAADPFAATVETCSRQSTCLALRHDARARAKRCAIRCFAQRAAHGKCIPAVRARFSRSIRKLECDDHRSSFLPLCLCFTSKPAVRPRARCCDKLSSRNASLSSVRSGRGERREARKHTGATQCTVNRQNGRASKTRAR